ncbi:unnamed protein product [Hymenolepis diminuta]|uniref:Uncharacterized protein n=1 Tax=Hymenolepis diminuta TaxID=6216 RepID=A0A564YK36_HYMDI|nr:unnamed protein product [Hymenolepis diminuta]
MKHSVGLERESAFSLACWAQICIKPIRQSVTYLLPPHPSPLWDYHPTASTRQCSFCVSSSSLLCYPYAHTSDHQLNYESMISFMVEPTVPQLDSVSLLLIYLNKLPQFKIMDF